MNGVYGMVDVKTFLKNTSREVIIDKLTELALSKDSASLEELKQYLLVADDYIYNKHSIPRLVCRSLLYKGKQGVEVLKLAMFESPGSIYPTAILEALWYASREKIMSRTNVTPL